MNCEYGPEFENDYDDRAYEETNESCAQYCNYGYKENYYEMRSYSSENMVNNV